MYKAEHYKKNSSWRKRTTRGARGARSTTLPKNPILPSCVLVRMPHFFGEDEKMIERQFGE